MKILPDDRIVTEVVCQITGGVVYDGSGGFIMPDTPVNLRITTQDATSAELHWDAHSQQTRVYISSDGTSWTLLHTVAAGTSTYQATGLTDDLNFFQVRAYDGTHQSAASNTVETYLKWILKTTGDGSGVSTLRLNVTETQTLTATGGVKFYTDAAGTQNESSTWEVTTGGLRMIYLRCPTDGVIVIPARDKVIEFGGSGGIGWESDTNAADLHYNVSRLVNLEQLRITGNCRITGSPPVNVTYWYLNGSNIYWTYEGAPPAGVTQWYLIGSNIYWTYEGAPPADVTVWRVQGSNIYWTYEGAPPADVTYWYLNGDNINWTGLMGNSTGNISVLSIFNFRTEKFTKEELIAFLEDMTTSTRGFPASITIGETQGLNPNSDQDIIDAVTALKAAKNITTVTFVN